MNEVNFKLIRDRRLPATLFVDGSAVKMKKQKDGSYACAYVTQGNCVDVRLCTVSETSSKFWWLTSLLFFVFSCFGIFDAHYDKKCRAVSYGCTLSLSPEGKNAVTLKCVPVAEGFKCVECLADCGVTETENVFFTDAAAKRRLKKLKIIKILSWVGIIVAAVLAGVLSIVL